MIAPPLEEQRRIVEKIEDSTKAIDDAAGGAQTEIDLLREYRTRLIADLVTGKLDVREAVLLLPDESEEPRNEAGTETDTEDDATDDLDAIPEEVEA